MQGLCKGPGDRLPKYGTVPLSEGLEIPLDYVYIGTWERSKGYMLHGDGICCFSKIYRCRWAIDGTL